MLNNLIAVAAISSIRAISSHRLASAARVPQLRPRVPRYMALLGKLLHVARSEPLGRFVACESLSPKHIALILEFEDLLGSLRPDSDEVRGIDVDVCIRMRPGAGPDVVTFVD